ncbi:unnamed protein product [Caenorhabditis auriculariae]|uniref:Uncharacterized protein n=1 Tax=Caenorhabditis auriculariae TaxID=2777116 RepID=A0A8S1H1N0_9PELO|nr:unnamed protein product [Caenorhabditis auriculariae]
MDSRIAVTLLVLLSLMSVSRSEAFSRSQLRYGAPLPAYAPHALYRFYSSRQFAPVLMSKRNNAEVVNHILKNFGTLDRLGDVGK